MRKLIWGYKADSDSYISHLKEKGAQIGGDVKIFSPAQTMIDMQAPYLLKIGSNVVMTGPVTILTHDYSAIVCEKLHQNDERAIASMLPVIIGDNVFIGWGATILPGTSIGSNTIIGAGAVVKGNIEANSVYAGNPAQRISSIESFYNRRIHSQVEEAYNICMNYMDRYGEMPEESAFHGYESLWKPAKYNNCKWNSFEEFCMHVRNRMGKQNY